MPPELCDLTVDVIFAVFAPQSDSLRSVLREAENRT